MELTRRVVVVGLYTDHGTIVPGDALRTRAYLRDASGNFAAIDFPGAREHVRHQSHTDGSGRGLLPPPR